MEGAPVNERHLEQFHVMLRAGGPCGRTAFPASSSTRQGAGEC